MKNLIKVKAVLRTAGIAALVAAIGFSMIACDSGGGGGGGRRSTPSDPTSATYTSYDSSGIEYKLVITKAAGRAAYSPQSGDTYELTITPPGTKSTGTVESVDGSTIKLKKGDTEFSLTVSGSKIDSFLDNIPVDNGDPVSKPEGTLSATKPGSSNAAKKITITGFGSKTGWVIIDGENETEDWIGGYAKISNGSVTIELKLIDSMSWSSGVDGGFALEGTAWNGSGSFALMLFIGDTPEDAYWEEEVYLYTNGKTFDELGITDGSTFEDAYEKLPKLSITSATTTIAFSKFADASEVEWDYGEW
jgi:hypothetical protein